MLMVDTTLAITLRILAGGAILDIIDYYGIGSATAYNVMHDSVAVLEKLLKFPKLSNEESHLERVSRGFKISRSSHGPLSNVRWLFWGFGGHSH